MKTLSTKKSTLLLALSVLGATSVFSTSANASDGVGPGDSDSKWILGTSVGALNNPYVGEDNDAWISPNFRYNGERVFIKEGSLNVHLTESGKFSAGLKFALDGGFLIDEDNYEDNRRLAGLKERDATILGGIYVYHDSDLGRFSFSTLTDVANEHDGRTVSMGYTFDLSVCNWSVNPTLSVEWMNDDYVNHVVGVNNSEATKLRAQYKAEDSFVAFAGVRARYEVTENWDVSLKTGVSKFGSEFKDSPIFEDDVVYQASVGINYNF